jgi:hypothetical protein
VVVPVKTLPSVRPNIEVVRLPARPFFVPLPEGRLPLPERLNGCQELLRFHAAEMNWKGLRAEVPKLPPDHLPDCAGRHLDLLEVHSETLHLLGEFRQRLNVEWPAEASPEEFEGGLRALENQTPDVEVVRARQYLGLRGRLEGRPDIARHFLGSEELPDGPTVLRDLKRLGGPEDLPPPPEVSPLDGLPLPEPEPHGLRAPVKESLGKGLPEFEKEATAAEATARKRVQGTVERSAARHANHVAIDLYNLRGVAKALASSDDDEEKKNREKEVVTHLGRRLSPAERLLARHLLRTMPPEQVAAELRALDKAAY